MGAKKRKILPPNKERAVLRKSARERLHEFWELFSKDDTVLVVINADPDALASAMVIKRLLRFRVKHVNIGYPNEIRRLSNVAMVDRLKIQAKRLQCLKVKDYSRKIIVDSQPSHLPCFENIKFDAVIDHHPVTEGWDAGFVDIRPGYGACASMLVEYLRAAVMKPSVLLATALFYAIKVDTNNFANRVILADANAFRYLFNIANHNHVKKIELSELRASELKYYQIALNEMKIINNRLYAHLGRVRNPDILVMIADFFNTVNNVKWVFVSGIHGERLVVIFRCDGFKKNAGRLAEKTFKGMGSAGGHREAARAEVPLKNLAKQDQEFKTKTMMRLIRRHI